MKHITHLSVLCLLLISCQNSTDNSPSLIAPFGEQPSISTNVSGEIQVVFGNKESIYYSSSEDQGKSFSQPSLVAKLEGLVLGHSSGPSIVSTATSTVITAPDTLGNLYAWTRSNDMQTWSGPFQINDVEKSAGESLSDITATPDGNLYSVWIDTRLLEENNHKEHSASTSETHTALPAPKIEEDLDEMTPIGITKGELYKQIGNVPQNARLSFHADDEGNLYWVLFDQNKTVLRAENFEEYKKFRERNGGKVKQKGKIYLSSSADEGKTWSKSRQIYRSPDGSVCECCKPSIISDNDGTITIMFRNNVNGSRDLYFTSSVDGGETFSMSEKLGIGTWKINGCPMDGGDLIADSRGALNTIWQRKGNIFMCNPSASEVKIGSGRSPSFSANDQKTYVAFSRGGDIMSTSADNSFPIKVGTGSSPKVIALKNGAIYFWVDSDGINFKKVL
jgi:hypothetical protein